MVRNVNISIKRESHAFEAACKMSPSACHVRRVTQVKIYSSGDKTKAFSRK